MRMQFHLTLMVVLYVALTYAESSTAQNDLEFNFSDLQPITPDNANQLALLTTLSDGVPQQLQWSPDGEMLAVSTQAGAWIFDGSDQMWEAQFIEGHAGSPSIVYSPNGEMYASIDCTYYHCPGQSLLIHQSETGDVLARVSGYAQTNPTFSSDGAFFAVGDRFGHIRLWRSEDFFHPPSTNPDGYIQCDFEVSSTVGDTLFSADATYLMSTITSTGDMMASLDFTVYVWDTKQCNLHTELLGHTDYPAIESVSSNGQYLLTAQPETIDSDTYYLWDLGSGEDIAIFSARSAEFSPDSTTLLIMGNETQIWNIATGERTTFEETSTALYLPSGALATGRLNGSIELITTDGKRYELDGHNAPLQWMQSSSDSRWLVSYDADNQMLLWSLQTQQFIQRWEMSVERLTFSPTGARIAWKNAATGEVAVWDTTIEHLHIFEQFRTIGSQMYLGTDGDILITYGRSPIDIWEISDSGIYHRHTIPDAPVAVVGDELIVTRTDQGFELWDVHTGLRRLETVHPYTCREPSLSPNNQYLACSVDPRTPDEGVIVWDTGTGEQLFSIPLFGIELAFDDRNEQIAVGGRDTTAVWRLDNPTQIAGYSAGMSLGVQLTFDNNGDLLYADGERLTNLTQGLTVAEMQPLQAGIRELVGCEYDVEGCETGQVYEIPYFYEARTTQISSDISTLVSVGYATGMSRVAIRFWDIATNTEIRSIERGFLDYAGIEFSDDGSLVVALYPVYWVGGAMELNRFIDLFDPYTGNVIAHLPTFARNAEDVALTPDNRLLFVSSDTIRVWGIAT